MSAMLSLQGLPCESLQITLSSRLGAARETGRSASCHLAIVPLAGLQLLSFKPFVRETPLLPWINREFDLLEQHNTSQPVVAMPRDNALGSFQQTPAEDPASTSPAEVVPGPPAPPLEREQLAPLPAPGKPVARTGFQASLRPYSSGQG
eukprot:5455545-Amphidinium_carterae.1